MCDKGEILNNITAWVWVVCIKEGKDCKFSSVNTTGELRGFVEHSKKIDFNRVLISSTDTLVNNFAHLGTRIGTTKAPCGRSFSLNANESGINNIVRNAI